MSWLNLCPICTCRRIASPGTVCGLRFSGCRLILRISAKVTANFGNVTDSAGLGVARCRL
ncbi:hypothetical protein F0160_38680 [Paraburkholderia sp. JPY303]|nr:hypothetical protein [Paraburkholderia atlantica]